MKGLVRLKGISFVGEITHIDPYLETCTVEFKDMIFTDVPYEAVSEVYVNTPKEY